MSELVTRRCSTKELSWKFCKIRQRNVCTRVYFWQCCQNSLRRDSSTAVYLLILPKFSEYLLLWNTLRRPLISCTRSRIWARIYNKTLFHIYLWSIMYKNKKYMERCSFNPNPLQLIVRKLICSDLEKC